MTDEELIEATAIEVMGLLPEKKKCVCSSFCLQYEGSCQCKSWQYFLSEFNSPDTDAVVEKFVADMEGQCLDFTVHITSGLVIAKWGSSNEVYSSWYGSYAAEKKNKALLAAILKVHRKVNASGST